MRRLSSALTDVFGCRLVFSAWTSWWRLIDCWITQTAEAAALIGRSSSLGRGTAWQVALPHPSGRSYYASPVLVGHSVIACQNYDQRQREKETQFPLLASSSSSGGGAVHVKSLEMHVTSPSSGFSRRRLC